MGYALLSFSYTLLLSLTIFTLPLSLRALFILFHILILLFLGLSVKKIIKLIRRVAPFLIVITLTSVFFSGGSDVLFSFPLWSWTISATYRGLSAGIDASAGILAVVTVTGLYQLPFLARSIRAMSKRISIFAPVVLAHSFMMASDGLHAKKPSSRSKGRSKDNGGRLAFIQKRIDQTLASLTRHAQSQKEIVSSERLLLVTAGAVFLTSLKAVRILPGIPYASGQKLMITIPVLTIVASRAGRWSATLAAWTFGFLSLILGQQGQLGILEVVRVVILGALVDLSVQLAPSFPPVRAVWYVATGALMGLFYATFSVTIATLFRVPDELYILASPRFAMNTVFGAIAGTLALAFTKDTPLVEDQRSYYNPKHGKGSKHRLS